MTGTFPGLVPGPDDVHGSSRHEAEPISAPSSPEARRYSRGSLAPYPPRMTVRYTFTRHVLVNLFGLWTVIKAVFGLLQLSMTLSLVARVIRQYESGCYDHTVRMWDIITGECKWILEGHSQKGVSFHLVCSHPVCLRLRNSLRRRSRPHSLSSLLWIDGRHRPSLESSNWPMSKHPHRSYIPGRSPRPLLFLPCLRSSRCNTPSLES